MSKVFYDRLPKDLQHIVNQTLAELIDYERELYTDISKNRLEQLKELGIIITYPDSEPFRKAAQDVYNEWADKIGGQELINKIQNFDYQR